MFKKYGPDQPNLDMVTQELMVMLKASMAGFEVAAKGLSEMTAGQEQLSKDTQDFVKWSRYFITGVLDWSLASRRYGMAKCLLEDGSLDIIL
jgi:hypothetical protein